MWDRTFTPHEAGGGSIHSSLSSSDSGSTETLRRWLAEEDIHLVEADLNERDRQRQEKKLHRQQQQQQQQWRQQHVAEEPIHHTTSSSSSRVPGRATNTTPETGIMSLAFGDDGEVSLFNTSCIGVYHGGDNGGSSSPASALSSAADSYGHCDRSGSESSGEWCLPAASRYRRPDEAASHRGDRQPLLLAAYSSHPPELSAFDAAPPASSNAGFFTDTPAGFFNSYSTTNLSSQAPAPTHNMSATEPLNGGSPSRRQKEEWELFLNDSFDETVDAGKEQTQPQATRTTARSWLEGAHFNNMCLAITYRDVYAKFFWSISPLAPAAMTEEMVRFALTSPDEAREDYPLTLNVYVCLLIGATHSGNVEMAKQMTERARWTLGEVFDNPDYNVAQALYVLALHVLYYECDINKCAYYMSLSANICRRVAMLNSDTFLRCIYGATFLPSTTAKELIHLRREYLHARRLPYCQVSLPFESLERAGLPMTSAVDRGNSVGMLLLNVMAGLSIYKARAAAQPAARGEAERRHLFPLLRALGTLEADLQAEAESEANIESAGRVAPGSSPSMASDDNSEAEDEYVMAEDSRLPYLQRVSFLMCVKALQADCARCLDRPDLSAHAASGFLQIAKRNAHFMQYMYCGMQPMVTAAVEALIETRQWCDLEELLAVTQPLATTYPLVCGLYAGYAQALEGLPKPLANEPPPTPPVGVAQGLSERLHEIVLIDEPTTNGAGVRRTSEKRRRDELTIVVAPSTFTSLTTPAGSQSLISPSSPATSSSLPLTSTSSGAPPHCRDRPLHSVPPLPTPAPISSSRGPVYPATTTRPYIHASAAHYSGAVVAYHPLVSTRLQQHSDYYYYHAPQHLPHQYQAEYSAPHDPPLPAMAQPPPPSPMPPVQKSLTSTSGEPLLPPRLSPQRSTPLLRATSASTLPVFPDSAWPLQRSLLQPTPHTLFLSPSSSTSTSSSIATSASSTLPPSLTSSASATAKTAKTTTSQPPRAAERGTPPSLPPPTPLPQPKKTKGFKWHKFAAVDGEQDLVQFKESAARPRRPRNKKPGGAALPK